MSTKLTKAQLAVLWRLAKLQDEYPHRAGWRAMFIGQSAAGICRKSLVPMGLVSATAKSDRSCRYYAITLAGISALRSPSKPLNARTQGVEVGR